MDFTLCVLLVPVFEVVYLLDSNGIKIELGDLTARISLSSSDLPTSTS